MGIGLGGLTEISYKEIKQYPARRDEGAESEQKTCEEPDPSPDISQTALICGVTTYLTVRYGIHPAKYSLQGFINQ